MDITNEQIEKAFEGTRFGTNDYRGLIQTALIDVAKGYSTGYTIAQVCNELGLMTYEKDNRRLTDKGWDYMRYFEHRAALTSLLEELPQDREEQGYYDRGWNASLDKIKSLIQNKLK